jgi:meiotic recombination protein SPO11
MNSARFHALVDADPHGIDIMQVYTLGSKSTTHSHDHKGLVLGRRLNWMGVKASEWLGLGIGYDLLLELTDKDVEKVSPSIWYQRGGLTIGYVNVEET